MYYYSDKKECDFIVKEGLEIIKVIQISVDVTEDNRKREIGGILEAMNKFNLNYGLITIYQNETIYKNNRIIELKSLTNWIKEPLSKLQLITLKSILSGSKCRKL